MSTSMTPAASASNSCLAALHGLLQGDRQLLVGVQEGAGLRIAHPAVGVGHQRAAPAANLSRRVGTGSPERADLDPVCLRQLAGAAFNRGQVGVKVDWPLRRGYEPHRQIRRLVVSVHKVRLSAVCAAQVRCRIQLGRLSAVW